MRYFTNSPFERLMMEPAEIRPEPPSLPPGHPCRGCNYIQNGACVGICWRKFFAENRKQVSAAKA
ncbi:MAG: hypothetical protein ABF904_13755 [Ethanoligenens sp.]